MTKQEILDQLFTVEVVEYLERQGKGDEMCAMLGVADMGAVWDWAIRQDAAAGRWTLVER